MTTSTYRSLNFASESLASLYIGPSLVILAAEVVGSAPAPVGQGKSRIEPDRFGVVGDGVVEVVFVVVGITPAVISFRELRVQPDGFVKGGNGLVESLYSRRLSHAQPPLSRRLGHSAMVQGT